MKRQFVQREIQQSVQRTNESVTVTPSHEPHQWEPLTHKHVYNQPFEGLVDLAMVCGLTLVEKALAKPKRS